MVTTFLATLNGGGGFAGYTDWRIPNIVELQSLVSYGAFTPSTFSVFNTSCPSSCTVLTCSCTDPSERYWSSSTVQRFPSAAWVVIFDDGYTNGYSKTLGSYRVRAVRAGS